MLGPNNQYFSIQVNFIYLYAAFNNGHCLKSAFQKYRRIEKKNIIKFKSYYFIPPFFFFIPNEIYAY